MKLYMAVTADRFELPMCVEESAGDLAKKLGIKSNDVSSACTPRREKQKGVKRGYKIMRIDCDDEMKREEKTE